MENEPEIIGTVDCTPTWESLVTVLLDVHGSLSAKTRLKQDQVEALANIKTEFTNMAKAADKWIEHCKQQKTETK